MNVNDGVTLVAAAGGLVDPHGVERDGPGRRHKPVIKDAYILRREAAKRRHALNVPLIRSLNHIKQTDKQPGVAAGGERQMQIGNITGGGSAGIDNHHLHLRVVVLRLRQPLIEYRMRPGGVRPDQRHQIAVFHILVAARHHVFAKGALVAHHSRGHAEPGVGIDVCRADKPFHQLVGGIVILGQQLAGGVKRHRLRPPFIDNLPQALSCRAQRLRPVHLKAVNDRAQKPPL